MKAVIVHRGSRDAYQVAWAFAERGLLERLITDLYWPGDRGWPQALSRFVPGLRARYAEGVPSRLVDCRWLSGLISFALDRLPRVPFSWRQRATRWADGSLGRAAGRLAKRRGTKLLSYSYYASSAFQAAGTETPRILFQLHPHPKSVRRLLWRELQEHPDCATSLLKEWELSLPEQEFERLSGEAEMAEYWITASSFTRSTLIENGTDPTKIRVVPYGVDCRAFHPSATKECVNESQPLRLLFVGTINQRKGIKYLLQALDLLRELPLEITICGRPVDDLSLFLNAGDRVRVRPSVSASELLREYQRADLFVLPSVAEGFGQVLLEAMASGVPVLGTTHTAAPDLVREGIDGFVVQPRRPDLLARRIEWAHSHRTELAEMGRHARARALTFTHARFRAEVVQAFQDSFAVAEREEVAVCD